MREKNVAYDFSCTCEGTLTYKGKKQNKKNDQSKMKNLYLAKSSD